jgi:GDPmannose 4,6-dehydratase
MARVLVTGAGGQIGSYVVDLLIEGGHEPLAIGPCSSRVPALGEELDAANAASLLERAGPLDAVIHLAALSSVAESWKRKALTFQQNVVVTAALLEAVQAQTPKAHFVHASSAEIFGFSNSATQSETTPIAPVSPYGISKAAAHMLVRITRESQGLIASNVIFYLGESERRPPHFVFRKITRGLAKVALGMEQKLVLGNIDVVRDFSHARDLARAAIHVALSATPSDYCAASGEGHSLREIVAEASRILGIDHEKVIEIDRSLFRPTDIASLIGDARKLASTGFSTEVGFTDLVGRLVAFDLAELRKEKKQPTS